jgi:hypothetical protein
VLSLSKGVSRDPFTQGCKLALCYLILHSALSYRLCLSIPMCMLSPNPQVGLVIL